MDKRLSALSVLLVMGMALLALAPAAPGALADCQDDAHNALDPREYPLNLDNPPHTPHTDCTAEPAVPAHITLDTAYIIENGSLTVELEHDGSTVDIAGHREPVVYTGGPDDPVDGALSLQLLTVTSDPAANTVTVELHDTVESVRIPLILTNGGPATLDFEVRADADGDGVPDPDGSEPDGAPLDRCPNARATGDNNNPNNLGCPIETIINNDTYDVVLTSPSNPASVTVRPLDNDESASALSITNISTTSGGEAGSASHDADGTVTFTPSAVGTAVFAVSINEAADSGAETHTSVMTFNVSNQDADGDGIPDDNDSCPDRHATAGPDGDPSTAADNTTDADNNGCPDNDPDGDGIPDDSDVCPTVHATAGPDGRTAGAFDADNTPDTDTNGCPDADNDGDGILPPTDLCPDTNPRGHLGNTLPDTDRDGCPDGDADGDGRADGVDACPDTHANAGGAEDVVPERRFNPGDGCPDNDSDGDGILNGSDTCPTRHATAGPDGRVNTGDDTGDTTPMDGCPDNDPDGDGVPNPSDVCPDTHATAGPDGDPAATDDNTPDADTNGCPDADNDGDGIEPPADLCPDVHATLRGTATDSEPDGCPDGDRDGDTIPDATDACPDTHATRGSDNIAGTSDDASDTNADGCPDNDRDGDGIPDDSDLCPGEAGTEPHGCPADVILIRPDTYTTAPETAVDLDPLTNDVGENLRVIYITMDPPDAGTITGGTPAADTTGRLPGGAISPPDSGSGRLGTAAEPLVFTPAAGAPAGVLLTFGVTQLGSDVIHPSPALLTVSNNPAVTIGGLVSRTGAFETFGTHAEYAMYEAAAEFNAYLGAKEGASWVIDLDTRDTRTDADTALAEARSLAAAGVEFVAGPSISASLEAIRDHRIANNTDSDPGNDYNLALVSPSSTSAELAIDNDDVFRLTTSDIRQGNVTANLLYNDGKRVLVPVYLNDPFGRGYAAAAVAEFERLGGESAYDLPASPEGDYVNDSNVFFYDACGDAACDGQFAAMAEDLDDYIVGLIKRHGADRVAVLYVGFESPQFMAAAAAHERLELVTWAGSGADVLIPGLADDGAVEEFAGATGFTATISEIRDDGTNSTRLADALGAQFPGEAVLDYVYGAYDSIWHIGLALETAGVTADTTDPASPTASYTFADVDLASQISSWDRGVQGPIELNAAGDVAMSETVVYGIAGGGWDEVGRYSASDLFTYDAEYAPDSAPGIPVGALLDLEGRSFHDDDFAVITGISAADLAAANDGDAVVGLRTFDIGPGILPAGNAAFYGAQDEARTAQLLASIRIATDAYTADSDFDSINGRHANQEYPFVISPAGLWVAHGADATLVSGSDTFDDRTINADRTVTEAIAELTATGAPPYIWWQYDLLPADIAVADALSADHVTTRSIVAYHQPTGNLVGAGYVPSDWNEHELRRNIQLAIDAYDSTAGGTNVMVPDDSTDDPDDTRTVTITDNGFNAINGMYSHPEYPFVINSTGILLGHGADASLPGRNGENLVESSDRSIADAIDALKAEGGPDSLWWQYEFVLPGTDDYQLKRSLLVYHQPTDSVVGSGYYPSFDEQTAELRRNIQLAVDAYDPVGTAVYIPPEELPPDAMGDPPDHGEFDEGIVVSRDYQQFYPLNGQYSYEEYPFVVSADGRYLGHGADEMLVGGGNGPFGVHVNFDTTMFGSNTRNADRTIQDAVDILKADNGVDELWIQYEVLVPGTADTYREKRSLLTYFDAGGVDAVIGSGYHPGGGHVEHFVGPQFSSGLDGLEPLLNREDVVVVSTTSATDSWARAGDGVFRAYPPQSENAAELVGLLGTLGKTEIILVHADDVWGNDYRDILRRSITIPDSNVHEIAYSGNDYDAIAADIAASITATTAPAGVGEMQTAVVLIGVDEQISGIFSSASGADGDSPIHDVEWFSEISIANEPALVLDDDVSMRLDAVNFTTTCFQCVARPPIPDRTALDGALDGFGIEGYIPSFSSAYDSVKLLGDAFTGLGGTGAVATAAAVDAYLDSTHVFDPATEADLDGDLVPDSTDRCPASFTSAANDPDGDGCFDGDDPIINHLTVRVEPGSGNNTFEVIALSGSEGRNLRVDGTVTSDTHGQAAPSVENGVSRVTLNLSPGTTGEDVFELAIRDDETRITDPTDPSNPPAVGTLRLTVIAEGDRDNDNVPDTDDLCDVQSADGAGVPAGDHNFVSRVTSTNDLNRDGCIDIARDDVLFIAEGTEVSVDVADNDVLQVSRSSLGRAHGGIAFAVTGVEGNVEGSTVSFEGSTVTYAPPAGHTGADEMTVSLFVAHNENAAVVDPRITAGVTSALTVVTLPDSDGDGVPDGITREFSGALGTYVLDANGDLVPNAPYTYHHIHDADRDAPPGPVWAERRSFDIATIGGLVPLTGGLSEYGEHARFAMQRAVADFNSELAVNGTTWRLALDIRDTGTDPATAAAQAQELVGEGIDLFSGPATSASVARVKADVLASNDLLFISPSSTSTELEAVDNIYRLAPSDRLQGQVIADVLYTDGAKRVLIPVWLNDAFGRSVAERAATEFEALGGETTYDIPEAAPTDDYVDDSNVFFYDPCTDLETDSTCDGQFPALAADLGAVVAEQIRLHGADRVAVLYAGFELEQLVRAAADHPVLGLVQWIGTEADANDGGLVDDRTSEVFVTDANLRASAYEISPFTTGGDNPTEQRIISFNSTLYERFPGEVPLSYVYGAYDSIWHLGLEIGRDLSENSRTAAEYVFSGIDVPARIDSFDRGALGDIELDTNGDLAEAGFAVFGVEGGDWTRVGGYDTEAGTFTEADGLPDPPRVAALLDLAGDSFHDRDFAMVMAMSAAALPDDTLELVTFDIGQGTLPAANEAYYGAGDGASVAELRRNIQLALDAYDADAGQSGSLNDSGFASVTGAYTNEEFPFVLNSTGHWLAHGADSDLAGSTTVFTDATRGADRTIADAITVLSEANGIDELWIQYRLPAADATNDPLQESDYTLVKRSLLVHHAASSSVVGAGYLPATDADPISYFVGPQFSSQVVDTAPLRDAEDVVVVSTSSATQSLEAADEVFRPYPQQTDDAQALIDQYTADGKTKIIIVHPGDVWGDDYAAILRAATTTPDDDIIEVPYDTTDYDTPAAAIAARITAAVAAGDAASTAVIFIGVHSQLTGLFTSTEAANAESALLDVDWYTETSIANEPALVADAEAAARLAEVNLTAVCYCVEPNIAALELADDLKRLGIAYLPPFASAYETVALLGGAFESITGDNPANPGTITPAAVRTYLDSGVTFTGALGQYTLDENGDLDALAGLAADANLVDDGPYSTHRIVSETSGGGTTHSWERTDVDVITIGGLVPMSGPLSAFGAHERYAMNLALVDYYNALKAEDSAWRISLDNRDTQTAPAPALEQARSLAEGAGAELISGPATSSAAAGLLTHLAGSPAQEFVMFSPSSTSDELGAVDNLFRLAPPNSDTAVAIANQAYNTDGKRLIIPVYLNDAFGRDAASATVAEFVRLGGQSAYVIPDPHPGDGTDYADDGILFYDTCSDGGPTCDGQFTAIVSDLAEIVTRETAARGGTDEIFVLYVGFSSPDLVAAALEHPALATVDWLGTDADREQPALLADRLLPFLHSTNFGYVTYDISDNARAEALHNALTDRFPAESSSAFVYSAYDTVVHLGRAINQTGDLDAGTFTYDLARDHTDAGMLEIVNGWDGGTLGDVTLDENGDLSQRDGADVTYSIARLTFDLEDGVPVSAAWPPTFGGGDSDGDGVPDVRDQCPNTHPGATVDATGCPSDADGDGVFDGIDQCSNTPMGATVNNVGCPSDADGDGVFDGIDTCPDTPTGATVDAVGCPVVTPNDSDGDGVPDNRDLCPNTPANANVNDRGCPVTVTPRQTGGGGGGGGSGNTNDSRVCGAQLCSEVGRTAGGSTTGATGGTAGTQEGTPSGGVQPGGAQTGDPAPSGQSGVITADPGPAADPGPSDDPAPAVDPETPAVECGPGMVLMGGICRAAEPEPMDPEPEVDPEPEPVPGDPECGPGTERVGGECVPVPESAEPEDDSIWAQIGRWFASLFGA